MFKRKYLFAILYSIFLVMMFTYNLLDTFVLENRYEVVKDSGETKQNSNSSEDAKITDTSYEDENISINIITKEYENTMVYIADVQVNDSSYLKTALAKNSYGKNIKERTSDIATSNNAILAINGDYYGFRNSGYVIRNSTRNL